ncbi:MAG: glycosyltransferase [Rhodothermaceae bacterium]|nr:glycosyltransferase [Rhodothermaceae bacterium]
MPSPVYPRLLLFDPYAGGHHAEHIHHLMGAWQRRCEEGWLVAAVAPRLLEQHPSLADVAFDDDTRGARLVPLAGAEVLGGPAPHSLAQVGRINGRLLSAAVADHRPARVHALYLDHLQLALAMRLRLPYPARLSGLLFRPDFHYGQFETAPPPVTERVRRFRKKLVLRAALRHPLLDTVLTLDYTAVEPLAALTSRVRIEAVPEPMDTSGAQVPSATVRAGLGVEPGRVLLVLFGILDERKGVPALLQALLHLEDSGCSQVTVVLAGRLAAADRARIEDLITRVRERPVQLILREGFVPDEEIQSLLGAADLVLVPYQRHVGSSGVLVRAAAVGTPILSQDYGLMGEQTRVLHLGQAADTTSPEAIAEGIRQFLADPMRGFDLDRARAFAAQNTPEGYADATLDALLSS